MQAVNLVYVFALTNDCRSIEYLVLFVGKFLHYCVQPITISRPTISAFDCLMSARTEVVWPGTFDARNKKLALKNDFFKQKGQGWGHHNVESHGKLFVNNLGDALWYIDGHWQKFASRSKPMPDLFSAFQNYNIPEEYKKKKERTTLERSVLAQHADKLNNTLL